MIHEEYNYWLANIKNIGPRKIEMLLKYFGSAEEIYNASGEILNKIRENSKEDIEYIRVRFTSEDVASILNSRCPGKIEENYAKLHKNSIYFVSKEDESYPEKLKNIYDAPFALYVKGKVPGPGVKTLAIVGARECSPYGKEMAKYLAGAVAQKEIAVISGLARGIDCYAHEGALCAGGVTYAVLGSGIDICYPKENMNLYCEIQKEGGIISEYPPGVQPLSSNFPMRNRIISGLCDAILVIEAKVKSGSLITVDFGLEQGKDIFALPGRATDRFSEGCNNLIKMGAKLVTNPKDILDELIPDFEDAPALLKKNNKLLESAGKIVYSCLSLEPKHLEIIALESKLPMDLLMEQLLLLELNGMVRQTMKNYFVIQNQ